MLKEAPAPGPETANDRLYAGGKIDKRVAAAQGESQNNDEVIDHLLTGPVHHEEVYVGQDPEGKRRSAYEIRDNELETSVSLDQPGSVAEAYGIHRMHQRILDAFEEVQNGGDITEVARRAFNEESIRNTGLLTGILDTDGHEMSPDELLRRMTQSEREGRLGYEEVEIMMRQAKHALSEHVITSFMGSIEDEVDAMADDTEDEQKAKAEAANHLIIASKGAADAITTYGLRRFNITVNNLNSQMRTELGSLGEPTDAEHAARIVGEQRVEAQLHDGAPSLDLVQAYTLTRPGASTEVQSDHLPEAYRTGTELTNSMVAEAYESKFDRADADSLIESVLDVEINEIATERALDAFNNTVFDADDYTDPKREMVDAELKPEVAADNPHARTLDLHRHSQQLRDMLTKGDKLSDAERVELGNRVRAELKLLADTPISLDAINSISGQDVLTENPDLIHRVYEMYRNYHDTYEGSTFSEDELREAMRDFEHIAVAYVCGEMFTDDGAANVEEEFNNGISRVRTITGQIQNNLRRNMGGVDLSSYSRYRNKSERDVVDIFVGQYIDAQGDDDVETPNVTDATWVSDHQAGEINRAILTGYGHGAVPNERLVPGLHKEIMAARAGGDLDNDQIKKLASKIEFQLLLEANLQALVAIADNDTVDGEAIATTPKVLRELKEIADRHVRGVHSSVNKKADTSELMLDEESIQNAYALRELFKVVANDRGVSLEDAGDWVRSRFDGLGDQVATQSFERYAMSVGGLENGEVIEKAALAEVKQALIDNEPDMPNVVSTAYGERAVAARVGELLANAFKSNRAGIEGYLPEAAVEFLDRTPNPTGRNLEVLGSELVIREALTESISSLSLDGSAAAAEATSVAEATAEGAADARFDQAIAEALGIAVDDEDNMPDDNVKSRVIDLLDDVYVNGDVFDPLDIDDDNEHAEAVRQVMGNNELVRRAIMLDESERLSGPNSIVKLAEDVRDQLYERFEELGIPINVTDISEQSAMLRVLVANEIPLGELDLSDPSQFIDMNDQDVRDRVVNYIFGAQILTMIEDPDSHAALHDIGVPQGYINEIHDLLEQNVVLQDQVIQYGSLAVNRIQAAIEAGDDRFLGRGNMSWSTARQRGVVGSLNDLSGVNRRARQANRRRRRRAA